jgi:hypothetical protein
LASKPKATFHVVHFGTQVWFSTTIISNSHYIRHIYFLTNCTILPVYYIKNY